MVQERIDDWWEYAKDLARAERELQIERWVYISIEYKDEAGRKCRLHSYDLPRELHERYRWVIRWREARLQCQYPRENINTYYSYYDKRTGLRTDFNSCLMKLAAAKAQITRAERKEAEYLAYQRLNNLFFDEQTDEQLFKFRQKLRTKKEAELAEKERELMRLRAERAAHEEKLSREQKEKQEAIRARDEALKAKEEALKMQAALALREQELATLAPTKNDNAVTSFRKGDNALAIEGLYTGLSMDIEKMRDDILQEMKYSYKQDISIYDDLAEKIESIKTIDANTLEEGLKPLQVLNTLDEKLNALQTVDYDCIVEKVSEKLTETKIDYDVLAERVAALMTSYAENAISPKMQPAGDRQRGVSGLCGNAARKHPPSDRRAETRPGDRRFDPDHLHQPAGLLRRKRLANPGMCLLAAPKRPKQRGNRPPPRSISPYLNIESCPRLHCCCGTSRP